LKTTPGFSEYKNPLVFHEVLSKESLAERAQQLCWNNNYNSTALEANRQFFHCLLLLQLSTQVQLLAMGGGNVFLEICRWVVGKDETVASTSILIPLQGEAI